MALLAEEESYLDSKAGYFRARGHMPQLRRSGIRSMRATSRGCVGMLLGECNGVCRIMAMVGFGVWNARRLSYGFLNLGPVA